MERACKSCFDLVSQKRTYSKDIIMSKRQSSNEHHQMLAWYLGEYKPKTSTINLEAAKHVLLTPEKPMIKNRRFGGTNDIIACESYMKHQDVPENKGIFAYGFQHIKTVKTNNYILFGCNSDEKHEIDRKFNFCCFKSLNEKIEKRDFKIIFKMACYGFSQN